MAIKIQGTTIINDETSFVSLAGTGALKLPVGTTAQGGAISAAAGMIRFNSENTVFEAYNGTAWGDVHTSVGDVFFAGTNHSGVTWDTSEDEFLFSEGSRLDFGGGANIRRESDGILQITGATADDTYFNFSNQLIFYRGGVQNSLMTIDGSIQRFHVNGKITVANNIELDDSDGSTNKMIMLGTGDDLKIYHDGSHSRVVKSGDGKLIVSSGASNNIDINAGTGGNTIELIASTGQVRLYYGGSNKLQTESTGITVTGNIAVSGNIELDDSDGSTDKMIILGTGNDLKIYHFGNSFIENDGTSDLLIRNSANDYDVKIQSDNGSGGIANYFVADGSVGAAEMHWGDYSTNSGADGGVKLATNASGVTITGTATATAFSGDGSALTNLPASADDYARTIALLGL